MRMIHLHFFIHFSSLLIRLFSFTSDIVYYLNITIICHKNVPVYTPADTVLFLAKSSGLSSVLSCTTSTEYLDLISRLFSACIFLHFLQLVGILRLSDVSMPKSLRKIIQQHISIFIIHFKKIINKLIKETYPNVQQFHGQFPNSALSTLLGP